MRYKNCSEKEFHLIKNRLQILKGKILNLFPNKLNNQKTPDESDYLNLNFSIFNDGNFNGNLAILFEDFPGIISFDVSAIKTFDVNFIRYFKRQTIFDGIVLELLEKDIEEIIESVLKKYYSWTEAEVRDSEKIELSR